MKLPVEVYFSPGGRPTLAIVAAINAAKSSILVQAYSFTSPDIANALVQADARGVQVRAILDDSNLRGLGSQFAPLRNSTVELATDSAEAIAHNKVMVIDEEVVLTGSFNFTLNAEYRNAENLLIIRDPDIAALYAANFYYHAHHSRAANLALFAEAVSTPAPLPPPPPVHVSPSRVTVSFDSVPYWLPGKPRTP